MAATMPATFSATMSTTWPDNHTTDKPNKLFTALLCTGILLCSLPAGANRPAMEERRIDESAVLDMSGEMAEEEAELSNRPSAVELMMQQQPEQPAAVQTGDVVQLPPVEMRAGETLKIDLLDTPRRGASMSKVQREFGEPLSMSDSVGNPPITRWIYADRIVYFEHSSVLHVVPRK
jgi:hypothetical protein